MGAKLAIVSPRVQTTRSRILGIAMRDVAQLLFIDTPGVFAAAHRFEKAMVQAAFAGAREADIVVLLADAAKPIGPETQLILEALPALRGRKLLALNKVDAVAKHTLPPLAAAFYERFPFERCFMISAATGDGVEDMARYLAETLPEGAWLYPEDDVTDLPMRQLAAEITREKLFYALRQELPYSLAVETESWEESKGGSIKIRQVIYVQRESQKKIVLGKGGAMLKQIGQRAREDIAKATGTNIHLFLFVKIAGDWKENPAFYHAMGLEYKP